MWFRRDLRLEDNAALHAALSQCDSVYPCFVFDREILDRLEDRADRRVEFIYQSISELDASLGRAKSRLIVRHGIAREEIPRLAGELKADIVFANHDYEPGPRERDAAVREALARAGRKLITFKDHVIFEKDELLNSSGLPFKVYTQYKNAWRKKLTEDDARDYSISGLDSKLSAPEVRGKGIPTLQDICFEATDLRWSGGTAAARQMFDDFLTRIDEYPEARNIPGVEGTSRLSVHLRFGTISIREVLREALEHGSDGAQNWIDELIWRDFYNMILHHFPHTEHEAFLPQFRRLPWRHERKEFEAWCEGRTGYPIVDAGMRQLNSTGWMHNRVRMITASFLTKHLRIDWKWGERYFARMLLDYDLSQNLGGWQWAASIGTDAQPYFRIFNPTLQSQRFDPEGEYIRAYVPELASVPADSIHEPWEMAPLQQAAIGCVIGRDYPAPIVDHAEARAAALEMFKRATK